MNANIRFAVLGKDDRSMSKKSVELIPSCSNDPNDLNDPNISGIILAAGRAARMDKVKQLLPFRDGTILGRVVQSSLCSSLYEVIVVLGHAAEAIRQVIDFGRARIVINADYTSGQRVVLMPLRYP